MTTLEAIDNLKSALGGLLLSVAWELGFTYSPSRRVLDGHGYSRLGKFFRHIDIEPVFDSPEELVMIPCPACGGTGYADYAAVVCENCEGSTWVFAKWEELK